MRIVSKPPSSLSNPGKLEIYFVGCGSAFNRVSGQNNILIIKGDTHLMVDCGSRALDALYKAGIQPGRIRRFLLTHTHADHIGSMEEILIINRYMVKERPTLYLEKRFADILWRESLRGGLRHNERRNKVELTLKDYARVEHPKRGSYAYRDGFELQLGTLNLKAFRTCHFPDTATSWKTSFYSIGLLIDERVLFTGDTHYDPELITHFEDRYNLETIFHDVQFYVGGIHAALDEIVQFPEASRRKMLLMHYPEGWEQHRQHAEQHRLRFVLPRHSYQFD